MEERRIAFRDFDCRESSICAFLFRKVSHSSCVMYKYARSLALCHIAPSTNSHDSSRRFNAARKRADVVIKAVVQFSKVAVIRARTQTIQRRCDSSNVSQNVALPLREGRGEQRAAFIIMGSVRRTIPQCDDTQRVSWKFARVVYRGDSSALPGKIARPIARLSFEMPTPVFLSAPHDRPNKLRSR